MRAEGRVLATFSHPDCTVGTGIAPVPAPKRSRAVTAGRELHPAPKVGHIGWLWQGAL